MEKALIRQRRKRFAAILVTLMMMLDIFPLPGLMGGVAYGSGIREAPKARIFFNTDSNQDLIIAGTANWVDTILYALADEIPGYTDSVWSVNIPQRSSDDSVPKEYKIWYRDRDWDEWDDVYSYVLKAPTPQNRTYNGSPQVLAEPGEGIDLYSIVYLLSSSQPTMTDDYK